VAWIKLPGSQNDRQFVGVSSVGQPMGNPRAMALTAKKKWFRLEGPLTTGKLFLLGL
jgi:hypothetical protein